MIAGNEIAAYVNDNDNEEEERKRSLCFVLPRKTTPLLTLIHSLFCFLTQLLFSKLSLKWYTRQKSRNSKTAFTMLILLSKLKLTL